MPFLSRNYTVLRLLVGRFELVITLSLQPQKALLMTSKASVNDLKTP